MTFSDEGVLACGHRQLVPLFGNLTGDGSPPPAETCLGIDRQPSGNGYRAFAPVLTLKDLIVQR